MIKPFRVPSCLVDGDEVILEEATDIRIEMLHHRVKMVSKKIIIKNSFAVMILFLYVDPHHAGKNK